MGKRDLKPQGKELLLLKTPCAVCWQLNSWKNVHLASSMFSSSEQVDVIKRNLKIWVRVMIVLYQGNYNHMGSEKQGIFPNSSQRTFKCGRYTVVCFEGRRRKSHTKEWNSPLCPWVKKIAPFHLDWTLVRPILYS